MLNKEPRHSDEQLIVCDVCDTLFYSNTTFDFIHFLVSRENRYKFFLLKLVTKKWSPFFYVLEGISRVFKIDLVKLICLNFLSGKDYDKVLRAANFFYDEVLAHRKIAPVFDLMERKKKEGEFVLVSSSISPVVKVIAERVQVSFISSEVEIKNGKLTGKMKSELKGKKHVAIQSLLKMNSKRQLTVITDNQSDFELVQMAGDRFIIIESELDKLFWKSLAPKYILK